MSIRQDQAQLIITIDAKESVEYQKAVQRSNELVRNIKKMEVGTEEYNAAIREQVKISKRLAGADYSKLSLKNLQDRRKALQDQIRILPQAQAAELGLEQELKRVNQALSENAARTRAVGSAMQAQGPNISFFQKGLRAAAGVFSVVGIIEGIKSIGRGLYNLGRDSITAFDGAAKAQAQLEAGLNSTGNTVGRTVEQLTKQASDLQKVTLFSDDQTQAAQGILLTFTKVREEIFDRSIPAIQDYATRMNVDLSSAAVTVGKALNDPIKGMGALSRAGVQFTEEQKETIKQMVATGDVVGAQTVILKELETQFQGSAKAAADAGLGPLQKFQNRIDDIKEGIGLLIVNGLGFLSPILDKVALFAEKVVDQLINGTKATGEMSTAVNVFVGVMKYYGGMLRITWDLLTGIYNALEYVIGEAQKIPILSAALNVVITPFKLLYEVVTNTTAVLAGFKAAFQAAFDNAADYVNSAITSLKIFAKEAELAITFDDKKEAALRQQIKALESQKSDYAKAGKSVGEAFNDAYNSVVAQNAKTKKSGTITGTVTETGASTVTGVGTSNNKSNKKENQYSEAPKTFTISSIPYIDDRFKLLEEAAKREQLLMEEQYQKGIIREDKYNIELLRNQAAHLATKLEMLSAAGLKESDKYREINVELLKTQKELSDKRAEQISELENAALTEVEQKFRDRLVSEEEYNLSRLAVQRNFIDEQLRLLEENGLTETEVYRKIQEEKAKVQADYNAQKLANEQRTQELMYQVQEQGLGAAADLFSLGAELLAGDEKARKKHASAIKAFETAKIAVNLAAEVQGIWKNANSNPINSLIPGWGPIYAAVQTGLAVGRAAIQVRNISSKQFKYGGRLKDGAVFDGPTHEYGGVKFGVGGEINEAEGGEIIINKRSSRVFAKELNEINTYNGYGKKLFSLGGVVSNSVPSLPSTTPTLSARVLGNNPAPQTIVQTDPRVEMLANSIEKLATIMPAALSNIRADVSYFDIKSKETTIEEIKYLARY